MNQEQQRRERFEAAANDFAREVMRNQLTIGSLYSSEMIATDARRLADALIAELNRTETDRKPGKSDGLNPADKPKSEGSSTLKAGHFTDEQFEDIAARIWAWPGALNKLHWDALSPDLRHECIAAVASVLASLPFPDEAAIRESERERCKMIVHDWTDDVMESDINEDIDALPIMPEVKS